MYDRKLCNIQSSITARRVWDKQFPSLHCCIQSISIPQSNFGKVRVLVPTVFLNPQWKKTSKIA